MDFHVPAPVLTAVRLLDEAGFSAYPVGGCVRDTLLGTAPHDWDMCTSASPDEMHTVFKDFRTIDTGIRHGTVSVIIEGMQLEITTFRTDGQYLDGRHPENVTFSTRVEDDLMRRDFTVNAMALDTLNGQVIDLFGGQEDLKNRIIRCVGNAEERFTEDALRILRALRFSARLGFTIEESTAAAMLKLRNRLDLVSRERVAQELNGFLQADRIGEKLLDQKEVLFAAIPELRALDGCRDEAHPDSPDAWTYAARAVSLGAKDLTVRWALLLEKTEMAEQVMNSLKMPRRLTEDVCCLIACHNMLPTDESLWPLLAKLGEERFFRLMDVQEADQKACDIPAHSQEIDFDRYRAEARHLLDSGACMGLKDLAVKGSDLGRAGITGPRIGITLHAMLRAVTRRECENDKEALLRMLKEGKLSFREE